MNWYVEVLKKYATFSGRASRSEYWYFYLFNGLIQLLIVGLMIIAANMGSEGLTITLYGISTIYSLVVMLPSLAVTIRRLHDAGYSGWWFLIVFTGIGILVLFIFLVFDSEQGDNKYGPNPKYSNGSYDQKITPENRETHGIINNSVYTGRPLYSGYTLVSENSTYPDILLEHDRIVLGRNGDIIIENDFVSSRHCEVSMVYDTAINPGLDCFIKDLNSTNGTYIDGRRLDPLTEAFIQKGERLILGSEEVVYRLQRI